MSAESAIMREQALRAEHLEAALVGVLGIARARHYGADSDRLRVIQIVAQTALDFRPAQTHSAADR